MSRKRMISPGFWEDSQLGRLPVQVRLLYIALWNFADDAGLLKADPDWLGVAAFGYDRDVTPEQVAGWLDQLTETSHLLRYAVEDKQFFCLRTFHQHQRIDHPTPSRLPVPPDEVLHRLHPDSRASLHKCHSGARSKAAP